MARARYHFNNVYEDFNHQVGPYILYQVGELYFNPDYVVEEHRQKVFEIVYVVAGNGISHVNGRDFPLKPGILQLIRPDDVHCITSSDASPLRIFFLGFHFSNADRPFHLHLLKDFFSSPSVSVLENAFILQDMFIGMFSQLLNRDFLSDTLLEAYMNQIICTSYRLFHQHAQYTYFVNQGRSADEQLLYDVAHYLDTHIGTIHSLKEIGNEFGYSYSYLAQKFSKLMHVSLKEYYEMCRFKKARQYLAEGMSVTTVSELVGFKSIHSFSNAFKKSSGESPSDFQKQCTLNLSNEPEEKETSD